MFKRIYYFLLSILLLQPCFAQQVVEVSDPAALQNIGHKAEILIGDGSQWNVATVLKATPFVFSSKDIPVFPHSTINQWLRFTVSNNTEAPSLFLSIQTPNLPEVHLYKEQVAQLNLLQKTGSRYFFNHRQDDNVDFNFDLNLPPHTIATFYLHLVSNHPLVLPLRVGAHDAIRQASNTRTLIFGAYCGILLVIFFYNLFIYFSVRDRSYLLYVVYVLFLGMAQVTSSGFGFKYFWPNNAVLNTYMIVLTSSLACIMGVIFAYYFLQIEKYTPRLKWVILYFVGSYLFAILGNFAGWNAISYNILDINGIAAGVILLIASAYIAKKGFRPAYFYLFAWSMLLLGVILYVLKNYGLLSSNDFTNYVLYIGSALESILLSIALADKINILQQERNLSQQKLLEASRKNEQLVKEQNLQLEDKVRERTTELENTNGELEQTLRYLKDTQSQLVNAEKMASLGVLTAGIAHEINNPINFVKANIKPLQLDIHDLWEVIQKYEQVKLGNDFNEQIEQIESFKRKIDIHYIKDEIHSLLQGIEDGAARTAEIVKGLRTFSRLDETSLKRVNLQEGIDATLILLRNILPDNVEVVKDYGAIPAVECYPGKLNQVFMNILNNAVYAIQQKDVVQKQRITISTYLYDDDQVAVSIEDTGMGMSQHTREKIFDPFFTTKDVGEGTGLGLSIVFNIIEKHKGKIIVNTEYEKGTTFVIVLPIIHPQ